MWTLIALAAAQQNLDFSQVRDDDGSAAYWGWGSDQITVDEGALRITPAEGSFDRYQNHVPLRRRFRARVRIRGEGDIERAVLSIETGDEASTVLGVAGRAKGVKARWKTYTTPWIELPDEPAEVSLGLRVVGSGSVWFDDIELFDEQGVFPEAPRPRSEPHEFPDRHWTAGERRVEPLPAVVEPDDAAWVREHHHPITSLGATDTSDLGFLADELQGVRVVQLGESSHGGEDFNALRIRLVRYLHEELGYDVLAFESSSVACEAANGPLSRGEAELAMKTCVYGVWWTEQVRALFAYAASTQGTERPLRVAGYDGQLSGMDGMRTLERSLEEVLGARAAQVVALLDRQDVLENAKGKETEREALLADWAALLAGLEGADLGGAESQRGAVLAWLGSQPRMVRHRVPGAFAEGQRDLAMGEQLVDLARRNPDVGVISWAHNFHVRYDGDAIHGSPSHGRGVREALGDAVFTIGAYAGGGSHALNNRDAAWVVPPPDGSLEAILSHAGEAVHYVRIRGPETPGWATRPLHTWDFGQSPEILVPVDQYDALIYVHELSPPRYVP
ncbi:MAG: erythromycin esterase family protein [Myxococcales bacterium]|nr:erythromycin esterase family protein [Myxococcales bacterium]